MNVLILTDFSEVSNNAARYAVDFLEDSAANFFFLNIQDFDFHPSASKILDKQVITILQKLEKSARELEMYKQNPQHNFNIILSSENLISAVRMAVVEKKIDLIFIGAISQKVHHHPILGDHAYDVVRKIQCNILAIPANCKYHFLKNVIFPIDYAIQPEEEIPNIISRNHFFNNSRFTILKLKEGKSSAVLVKEENSSLSTEFECLNQQTLEDFNEKSFGSLQKDYNLIFIIGKNLSICDRFLHSKYGLSASIDLQLPIFVYHN
ncbi:universal stress protein [Autumnicola musiva]|uniref:Universal stress protein n=1 Tax=Autumnicola musiva TaxID=3075589 RepID=A0ABU3DAW7_9FLAO|nr:universal stress protein [Zunongwangia sp. F117]MDT0678677.1 universal stress protein [Zunongwangia sp. F117]